MASPKCCAAFAIAIVVIGGGVVGLLLWLRPWEKSQGEDKLPGRPESDLLIKTSLGEIKLVTSADGDYKNGKLLVKEYVGGILGFDRYKDTIYYGTSTPNEPIFSSRNDRLDLASPWTKTALAVDFVSEKVYVLDRLDEKLHVVDMQDQYKVVVLADLDEPKDIVLDPDMGLIFILQKSSILQSNMDGSEAEVAIMDTDPTAIAIDRLNKIIYFATIDRLKSYDYRKRETRTIMKTNSKVISLSVTKNEVFFVTLRKNNTAMKDLNYCSMAQDGLCNEKRTRILISSGDLQEIKSYRSDDKSSTKNPCQSNPCPNLCLLSKGDQSLSHTCACSTGMIPMNNNKSCRPATNHLLYVQDEKIRARVPTNGISRFDQAEESNFQFDISSLLTEEKVDFDYHYRSNLIIFTDGSTIHYANLTDNSHWKIEGASECEYANPAIDWVSNCAYYIKKCGPMGQNSIVRRGIETHGTNMGESTLIKVESAKIESLAIHPGFGWIFYSQKAGDSLKFFIMHVDGLRGSEVSDLSLFAFAVDAKSDRLYGLQHFLSGVLEVNLRDWDIRLNANFQNTEKSSAITASGDSIYLSNSNDIWTAQGSIFPRYASGRIGTIRAAKLIGADVQYVDERWNHPCISQNGGCSRYCLAMRQKVNEKLDKKCACNDNEELQRDGITCKKFGPKTNLLIKTTDGTIKLVTPNDGDYSGGKVLVEEYISGILGFDYYNEKIYYGTSTPNDPIFSSSGEQLNSTTSWTKTALAVDYMTEKIYVLDRMDQKVHVVDMQDQYRTVVLTDLDDPRNILLDPGMGLMFILQSSSILQSNMDGTEAEIVIKNVDLSAISIDRHNKILYYATSKSLESYDYREKKGRKIMTVTSRIISMSVTQDEIVFISLRSSNTAMKDLSYCPIQLDGSCDEKQIRLLTSSSNIEEVKDYGSHDQSSTISPCNEYSCPNLCILKNSKVNPYLSHSCACTSGMVPMNSNTACKPATTHLLYVQDQSIRAKALINENSELDKADESNFQFDISSLSTENKIYFDYHYRLNLIIFTEGSTIHYTNLTDSSHWEIEGTLGCEYTNPVIDWVSNCVYFIKKCETFGVNAIVRRRIELVDADRGESTVKEYSSSDIGSLAIHPGYGLIFFTLYKNQNNARLYSLSVDGVAIEPFAKDQTFIETGLAVDARNDRLYALVDSKQKILEISLETCLETPHAGFPDVKNLRDVTASRGSIFASNSKGIWTTKGSIFPSYASGNVGTIRAAKVIGADVQYVDERWNHPCRSHNGGCERYCLATKKKTNEQLVEKCACNDDEKLQSDGTCIKKLSLIRAN